MSTARDLYGACSEIEVALDCLFREQGHRAAYADNALAKIRAAIGDGVFPMRSPEPAPAEQGEELRETLLLGKGYARQALDEHEARYHDHPATKADRDCILEDIDQIDRVVASLAARPQPESAKDGRPIVVERFADNGAHSHWDVIDGVTGGSIFSWEPDESDRIHSEAQGSEGRETRDAAWLKCRAEREPLEGSDDWTVGEVGTYRGFFNLGYEAARLAQSPASILGIEKEKQG